MQQGLSDLVRRRAANRCEYCLLPERASELRHVVDHVIALQHEGDDQEDNLALACVRCNRHKGPNVSGVEPATRTVTRLFHPRRDRWDDHFEYIDAVLVGRTSIGVVTAQVLAINLPVRIAVRRSLMDEGFRFRPG